MDAVQPGMKQWTREQGIKIDGVAAKRFAGKGLGFVAEGDIESDKLLVDVPTSAILSLHTIPPDYVAKFEKALSSTKIIYPESKSMHQQTPAPAIKPEDVTAHAILASYLAFHPSSPISPTRPKPHPWPLTWPSPMNFWTSMPMLWGPIASDAWCENCRGFQRDVECNHTLDSSVGRSLLPPTVWKMVQRMREKLKIDWMDSKDSGIVETWLSEAHLREGQSPGVDTLNIPMEPKTRFTYCWVVVNTRCFYYTIPRSITEQDTTPARTTDPHTTMHISPSSDADGISSTPTSPTSPPSDDPTLNPPFPDRNDNMALVPFLDLFNHISSTPPSPDTSFKTNHPFLPIPCPAAYTAASYTLRSPPTHTLRSGSEVYTSYGTHSQDLLFAEYGFTLPPHSNTDDHLELDPIILPTLSAPQIEALRSCGFWQEYSLYPNPNPTNSSNSTNPFSIPTAPDPEICFRTQLLALLIAESHILPHQQTTPQENSAQQNSVDEPPHLLFLRGTLDLDSPATAELREEANGIVSGWIRAYAARAEWTLGVLERIRAELQPNPAEERRQDQEQEQAGRRERLIELFGGGGDGMDHILASTPDVDSTEKMQMKKRECALRRLAALRERWGEIRDICSGDVRRGDWFEV